MLFLPQREAQCRPFAHESSPIFPPVPLHICLPDKGMLLAFCALLHKNTRDPKLSAAEGICTYHSHAELFQKFCTCPEQATEAEPPGVDTHTERLGTNTQGSQLYHQLTTFRYNHTNLVLHF